MRPGDGPSPAVLRLGEALRSWLVGPLGWALEGRGKVAFPSQRAESREGRGKWPETVRG